MADSDENVIKLSSFGDSLGGISLDIYMVENLVLQLRVSVTVKLYYFCMH